MLDLNKPVRTKSGKKVTIIYTRKNKNDYPLITLIGEDEEITSYTMDGKLWNDRDHGEDLINIPEMVEITRWINIYPDSNSKYNNLLPSNYLYRTEKDAADNQNYDCIACVPITFKIHNRYV